MTIVTTGGEGKPRRSYIKLGPLRIRITNWLAEYLTAPTGTRWPL